VQDRYDNRHEVAVPDVAYPGGEHSASDEKIVVGKREFFSIDYREHLPRGGIGNTSDSGSEKSRFSARG
jgi:hypothetical protein